MYQIEITEVDRDGHTTFVFEARDRAHLKWMSERLREVLDEPAPLTTEEARALGDRLIESLDNMFAGSAYPPTVADSLQYSLTDEERGRFLAWVSARMADGAARSSPELAEGAGLTDLRKALGRPDDDRFVVFFELARLSAPAGAGRTASPVA